MNGILFAAVILLVGAYMLVPEMGEADGEYGGKGIMWGALGILKSRHDGG